MLSDADWQTLVGKIRAVACTPFIGAGACAGVLPMAGSLAKDLLQAELGGGLAPSAASPGPAAGAAGAVVAAGAALSAGAVAAAGPARAGAAAAGPAAGGATGLSAPVPEPWNLAQVTQFLAVRHEDNSWPKLQIANLWKQAPRPDFGNRDEPHSVLANLRLPVYLTTNYDDFMVSALRARGISPRREICRWNRLVADNPSAFDTGYQPTQDEPVVFHLHGHADLHDSIVVTEDDYLDFVVAISKDLASTPSVAGQRALLPLRIRSAITCTTLLFVGYSLSDVNFRVILRGLVGSLEPSSRRLSIAVQLPPTEQCDPERLQAYLDQYFRWTLNVRIFWGSAEDFGRQLRERL